VLSRAPAQVLLGFRQELPGLALGPQRDLARLTFVLGA
jgi:hypothetical protein